MLRQSSAADAQPLERQRGLRRAAPVSDDDIDAIEQLARDLEHFAGALRSASPETLPDLLRPAQNERPADTSILPAWMIQALQINVLHRSSDSRLDRALAYIRTHCPRSTLSLSDVADFVRMSRWHFSRLLRRHVGMSFRDLVRALRMERAVALLDADVLTIKEIAGELGFAHATEFDRQFKQTFGVTPTTWRARRSDRV